jgi:hypothetical protein
MDGPGLPADLETVRAIRAALLAEEVPVFDAEFRAVMAESAEALDLAPVLEFLRHWRRVAASTVADPAGHRRMLAYAADHAAGRTVPTEPWDAVKARLGR